MDTEQILNLLKNSKKSTSVKVYIQGNLDQIDIVTNCMVLKMDTGGILIGDWEEVQEILEQHAPLIEKMHIENDRRNSAIGLLDLKELDARVEPGAIIREGVAIDKDATIMMGATVNIGAKIGSQSLIDMNAVIGGRAQIGCNCHIGAGVVIKGVISSPNTRPVEIEDEVIIGPNAVIMEGIHIGKGAIIPAGSIVTRDVLAGEVYST